MGPLFSSQGSDFYFYLKTQGAEGTEELAKFLALGQARSPQACQSLWEGEGMILLNEEGI